MVRLFIGNDVVHYHNTETRRKTQGSATPRKTTTRSKATESARQAEMQSKRFSRMKERGRENEAERYTPGAQVCENDLRLISAGLGYKAGRKKTREVRNGKV